MKYAIAFAAASAAVVAALPQPGDEWNTVPAPPPPPATSTWATWSPVPAPPKPTQWTTWAPAPAPEKKTCTTIYVTKDCGAKVNDWDTCKDVTKTDVLYDDKCTWAGWDQPAKATTWAEAPAPAKVTTWAEAPAPAKVCTYVTTYTTVYTTKDCGAKVNEWDACKDVTCTDTKTETKTDEKCTGTWGEWNTWAPAPAKATTWAEAPAPAKATTWAVAPAPAAATTWAAASVSKPAPASSVSWAAVAKFTGAADKQVVGFGAAAIAAVAMML